MTLRKTVCNLSLAVPKYILGVFVCLLVVLGVVAISPLLLIRWIAQQLAPWLRPDLGKMLNASATFFAMENPDNSPKFKLVFGAVTEGCPTQDDIRQGLDRVLKATNPKTGLALYPELCQSIQKWMGYLFWKNTDTFNPEDHFEFSDKLQNLDDAKEFMRNESLTPFPKGKPMWKFFIFPSFSPPKNAPYFEEGKSYSYVLVCAHHALFDGFSIVKLCLKLFDVKDDVSFISSSVQKYIPAPMGLGQKFVKLLQLPYDIVDTAWHAGKEINVWDGLKKPKVKQLRKKAGFHSGESSLFPFQEIKEIRSIHGVSILAVVFSAIAGSIRRAILKNGGKVPNKINTHIPFPLPGHPDSLRNHMYESLVIKQN
jgi:hypothetical protein